MPDGKRSFGTQSPTITSHPSSIWTTSTGRSPSPAVASAISSSSMSSKDEYQLHQSVDTGAADGVPSRSRRSSA